MALHTQNDSGHSEVDLFATFIFLGALCCAVLGIKLKWFKANLALDNAESNTSASPVQARNEVYRTIATDLYTPSFRVIDEREYDKPAKVQIGKPVLQSTTRDLKPKLPSTVNNQSSSKVGEDLSKALDKSRIPSETKTDKSKIPSETKTESKSDVKSQKDKEKEDLKKQKEEEKRIKKEKEEKAKAKARAKAREEKKKKEEKQKEEKLKKDEKQKEEKLKKEEKQKKEGKSKKDDTSKPVASVTIDAEAVESTQRNLQNEVTFSKVKPKEVQPAVDNQARNARNRAQVNQAPADSGFSSSWDMVAAHRQNLQREVKTPTNNNLRGMSSQNASNPLANLSKTDRDESKSKMNNSFLNDVSENSDTEA